MYVYMYVCIKNNLHKICNQEIIQGNYVANLNSQLL